MYNNHTVKSKLLIGVQSYAFFRIWTNIFDKNIKKAPLQQCARVLKEM